MSLLHFCRLTLAGGETNARVGYASGRAQTKPPPRQYARAAEFSDGIQQL